MKIRKYEFCIFIMLFIALNSTGVPARQESNDVSEKTPAAADSMKAKNPTGAMLRSLFIPGWGQIYNGKWFKGVIIAGAEAGLVANAIVLNQWANEATTEAEYLYYIDNRNLSFWLLGAAILYSMADAYVDAALADFDESPDLSFNVRRQKEPHIGISSTMINLNIAFQF